VDDDVRATGVHVLQPSSKPVGDGVRVFGRHLSGRLRPPFDQHALENLFRWLERPVARRSLYAIARLLEDLLREGSRVRTSRWTAEPLISPLMPVQQLTNQVVFRLDRIARRSSVLGDGEESCRSSCTASTREIAQP
jgi:hypothetical protein